MSVATREKNIQAISSTARNASLVLAALPTKVKNNALQAMADALVTNKERIIRENQKDIAAAEKLVAQGKLSKVMLKRLLIDEVKIREMKDGLLAVMKLDDPCGKTLNALELDHNLELYQVTCPIGVIACIFESRPELVQQISSLTLKSGNAIILKGGSEATYSHRVLADIFTIAVAAGEGIPQGWMQLVETREEVAELLKQDRYIDLLIPRGSAALVKYIKANTTIPVLGHAEGICHVFVDRHADLDKALSITYDAKVQYPSVCNAMETLLVDQAIAQRFLPLIAKKYHDANVEMRGCPKTKEILNGFLVNTATEEDWRTEYNDLIVAIMVVDDLQSAIDHINTYGSKHTEAIVTEHTKRAHLFMLRVDAANVMHNCSTRFSDGYRYGKGAEIGISTGKIHARGPVGLEGLVIYKYLLKGNGQVVATYSGKNPKAFTHRPLKEEFRY
ncbi:glutamate-5-semialdehyde dehydrogenase [Candidatus Woesearchaeota archaeon]|nr:glutamate-5-semialdehyde dehydrogenase [Candidatus Woesearchaeota archaeon]